MKLIHKEIIGFFSKNKIFIGLLMILVVFNGFMYYFVHFSIDGNMEGLNKLAQLSENQTLYKNALDSNILLARNFLIVLTSLTGFVFSMFFYRVFTSEKRELGCLKALGFKDRFISFYFSLCVGLFSLVSTLIGLGAGYMASDILIKANRGSYLVEGLVKEISLKSFMIGLFVPMCVFLIITWCCYALIRGKEVGLLISGNKQSTNGLFLLKIAHGMAKLFPSKKQLSVRTVLRKPIPLLLIITGVMGFSVMLIMGNSLHLTSAKVLEAQTKGHYYGYETQNPDYQLNGRKEGKNPLVLYALSETGQVIDEKGNVVAEQKITSMENKKKVFNLLDSEGNSIGVPQGKRAFITPALQELYGIEIGDDIILDVNGSKETVKVSNIAVNGLSEHVYINQSQLVKLLGVPENTYNHVFSLNKVDEKGTLITNSQRMETLDRGAVSNNSSAVINQSIGILVGCILIFLGLLLNFRGCTSDILILDLMGYKRKNIKKLLLSIYRPVTWIAFAVTLWPSIKIAQSVQKSLSIQTGDYMPFQINLMVIVFIFILLNLIYFLVESTFGLGVKKIIRNEQSSQFIYSE